MKKYTILNFPMLAFSCTQPYIINTNQKPTLNKSFTTLSSYEQNFLWKSKIVKNIIIPVIYRVN